MINFRPLAKFDKQAAIILLHTDDLKSKRFPFRNAVVSKQIALLNKNKQFTAQASQHFPILLKNKMILLVGLGDEKSLSLTQFRIAVRKAILSPLVEKAKTLEVIAPVPDDDHRIAVIEGIMLGGYLWQKYKTDKRSLTDYLSKSYVITGTANKMTKDWITVCDGVNLCRDLVNDNADVVHSDYLEERVKEIVKSSKSCKLEILKEKEMKKAGLGLHLAVNQGSQYEPRLMIVQYQGNPSSQEYTALIGKGITYDTGGINLKPSGHIETMRMDMGGAAAVIGTMHNALKLNIPKNIIFVTAVAENAIDAKSYKPGDVITGYAGKTVEIGNTDAEGRLVLADAISYVKKNYQPARIIDIATLTGACIVALGVDHTGLVSTDDALAKSLIQSSKKTDDRAWRLPIYEELKESVKSSIADIRNLGMPKGVGGTITAAEFLRFFIEDTPWAHLDIAGTCFVEGNERWYYGHGAKGSAVRLLTHYLMNQ
ncbi:MAG: leucyl aminopeptidase [Candidatus Omnitrophica bacterium]|nr:leucyl aminopeptidase [Candidatus Omnitrophota bacterium]